ncbi:MAG: hypothetical protein B7X39_07160 [Lysobacterales bacterium 14-68-21]|jgi:hypothetical protein|nr:MAG: hypothetical protein B7X45_07505 [Xanthomonadales bacterium 15-68-25]OZB67114.1 MAG: hypothetical protein B7X39_07160 [Xanthomonadales bacterium 14-68-21]
MNAGPATLRTLPAVPDPSGHATGIQLASAHTHGSAAGPWRLHLQHLDPGAHSALRENASTQLAPLDAPLALGDPGGRPLLRLQVASLLPNQTLHLAAPTRVVRLERSHPDDAELIARPLQGPMLLPTTDQGWLAWLLVGHAVVKLGEAGWELAAGVPAWLPTEAGQRLRLEGAGELLLVRFRTIPAA